MDQDATRQHVSPAPGEYEAGFQALLGKKAPLLDGADGCQHRARGFRCDVCKKSFSDDRSYIAHTHSPEHLAALGLDKDRAEVTDASRIEARIRYNAERLGKLGHPLPGGGDGGR